MRAWLMDSYKGVGELRLGEVPDPQPGPGQALLEMKFAALNPADAFLAQGMYPAKPPLPHILGRDGVGKVIAVGVGVENVKVGDTVALTFWCGRRGLGYSGRQDRDSRGEPCCDS